MNKKEEIINEYQQKDFVETFDKTRSEWIFHKKKHEFETKIINNSLNKIKKEKIKVLDVACGTGRILSEIIKDSRVEYTGLDTSKEMLEILKKKFSNRKINVVLSEGEKMPFKDESFDLTFTYHLLWHLPWEDQQKIIREMIRVTKKGGLIVFDSLNERFLTEKVKRIFGLKIDSVMYRTDYKKVRKTVHPLNFETDKLLDAPIKNRILFGMLNILNGLNKFLPSSFFHMIFFTIKKIK